jgi:hypothetical protein
MGLKMAIVLKTNPQIIFKRELKQFFGHTVKTIPLTLGFLNGNISRNSGQ